MSARKFLSATLGASAVALTLAAGSASAQIRITEWMYSGASGEFVELTNMGAAAVDFAGYSYDDDSRLPGAFSLAGFGLVQSGESVVFTESAAADFRLSWGLSASVKVLGGVTNNLGRNDEINIFDGNTLVDRLTFGDQTFPGTIRTQNASGRPGNLAAIGANDPFGWILSTVGDVEGSFGANGGNGDIGSPGFTSFAPSTTVIPVPGAALLMTGGLALVGFAARRRNAR